MSSSDEFQIKKKIKVKKEILKAESDFDDSLNKEYSSSSPKRKSLLNQKRKLKEKGIKVKEEPKKKKKKSKIKKKKSEFFDIEAEESSSDDEDNDDHDGEITKEEQARLMSQINSNIYKQKAYEDINEDELIERYNNIDNNEEIDPNDEIEHNGFQARIDDPKLWMIKCKIGKEKECLSQIFHKFFYIEKYSVQKLRIFSAICFDSLKGYIYVEAFKEWNVREAIAGISHFYHNQIKIVPLDEMAKVFEFDKFEKVKLKVNQWIKMKTGAYEGDIGQIIGIHDPINKIYVKLIPRMKTNPFVNKGFKPPKKLFNPKDVDGVLDKTSSIFGPYLYYNREMFKNGFLIKRLKITSLITEGVIPSIDDLRMFESFEKDEKNDKDVGFGVYADENNEVDQPKEEIKQMMLDMPLKKKIIFHKGDRVKITQNDFKGIAGRVIIQNDNTVKLKINVEDLSDEIFEFPIDSVIKDFLPGDLVHCIRGANIGKQGCLVKIEEETETAIIYSEAYNNHFKASLTDLVLSNTFESIDHDPIVFNINIGELVQVQNKRSSIFYVVNVYDYSLKIISQWNEIHTVSCRDVCTVKPYNSCLDGKNNPIARGDIIKVIEGKYQGAQAIIKVIYLTTLFLYNESFTNTNGIFALNNKKVEILGSELLMSNPQNGKVNFKRIPLQIKELIGKIVKVTKEKWKGYSGTVISVTDKTATVELLSKAKNIIVDLENIVDVDNQLSQFGLGNDNNIENTQDVNSGVIGWNTPAYYPQTSKPNNNDNNPSRTPNYFETEIKW